MGPEKAAVKEGKAYESIAQSQDTIKDYEAFFSDPKNLRTLAWERVAVAMPRASIEERRAAAESMAAELEAGGPAELQKAIEKGALVMPPEMGGKPSEAGPGMGYRVMGALMGPFRGLAGMKAGAGRAAEEIVGDAPQEESVLGGIDPRAFASNPIDKIALGVDTLRGRASFKDLLAAAATVAVDPLGLVPGKAEMASTIGGGQVAGVPANALAREVVSNPLAATGIAYESLRQGLSDAFNGTFVDDPVTDRLKEIGRRYRQEAWAQAEKEMASGAIAPAPGTLTPEYEESSDEFGEELVVVNPTIQGIKERASALVQEKLRNDTQKWGLENPELAGALNSMTDDPLNFLPAGWLPKILGKLPKGVATGSKAAAIIKGVQSTGTGALIGAIGGDTSAVIGAGLGALTRTPIVGEALRGGFRKGVKYLPWFEDLKKSGHEDLASMMRARHEIAGQTESTILADLEKNLAPVDALTLPESKTLAGLLKGERPDPAAIRAEFGDKIGDAYESVTTKIEPEKTRMLKETGVGSAYDSEGTLKGFEEDPNYDFPRRVKSPDYLAEEQRVYRNQHAKQEAELTADAAKERTGSPEGMYLDDVAKQYRAEFRNISKKASVGDELQHMDRLLKQGGKIKTIDLTSERVPKEWVEEIIPDRKVAGDLMPKISELDAAQQARYIDKVTSELRTIHGVDFVPLRTGTLAGGFLKEGGANTLEGMFKQATRFPGDKLADDMILLPAPVKEHMDHLAKLIGRSKSDAENMLRIYDDFSNKFYRPARKNWSLLKTIVGGPTFFVRNAISGVGLAILGMGAKGMDPILHAQSLRLGILGAAAGSPEALEGLKKIDLTLRSGQKASAYDVWKAFESVGLSGQMEKRLNLTDVVRMGSRDPGAAKNIIKGVFTGSKPAKQKLSELVGGAYRNSPKLLEKGLAFGDVPGLKYASPMFWSRATENYQHMVTFLGFLDDLSEKGIARALDLSSKYSGNYNRLSQLEKSFMKDAFGFYAWSRFIGPHFVQQMAENPQRLAAFIKARNVYRASLGEEGKDKYGWQGRAAWLRENSVMAPDFIQPKMKDNHHFAVLNVDDPVSMGLSTLKGIASYWPGNVEAQGTEGSEMTGPALTSVLEFFMGRDVRTGEKLEGIEGWAKNQAGDFIDRPSRQFLLMNNWLRDNGHPDAADSMWWRYAAMRMMMGAPVYLQKPIEETARVKRDATYDLGETLDKLKE